MASELRPFFIQLCCFRHQKGTSDAHFVVGAFVVVIVW